MATLRVENIPDELRERLERQARKRETTLDAVVIDILERQARRLEFREDLVVNGGLIVTNDPYAKVARERARRAAEDGVNGSTRNGLNATSLTVENTPDELYKRLQRQVSYLNKPLNKLLLDVLGVGINTIEFYDQMAAGPPKEYSFSPSGLVRLERDQRDADIDF